MTKKIAHIIRWVSGIFLTLLTVANASGQRITVEQCDTMTFSVDSRPNIDDTHFVWDIYEASDQPKDVLDPAGALDRNLFVDGMYAGRSVKVTGLEPGRYYVRIHLWDEISCTDNIEMYVMEVVESTLDMKVWADSVCIGEATNVYIRFSGLGPYTVEYRVGDELTSSVINFLGTPEEPDLRIPITQILPVGETKFWVMKITDDCKVFSYEEVAPEERPGTGILIYPKPTKQPIYLKEND